MTLELTKTQVENLIDFFETDFIDSIRNDTDVDSMGYICSMFDVYKKLQALLRGDTE